eukprot:TRINITY_DN11506_c0_g1_i1.p1 TRINITY_DN11506_c0_g1~~TRINITY_DN11506_c0_g1_i1.p1  ORF type:complete len:335 (+),score=82.69 TRINITY_DN11506_c0_g1_i1:85-1089(+)
MFSWGYELWACEPVCEPVQFCWIGVAVVADRSYGAPEWPMRAVRLKTDGLPLALQAEVDFHMHPFVDAAVRVVRDQLAEDALLVQHSLLGAQEPPAHTLTPQVVAGVALQQVLLLNAFAQSNWCFAHDACWRYAVSGGAVLARLADLSSALPRRSESGSQEHKAVGMHLVRLITLARAQNKDTPAAQWEPALDFGKQCFLGDSDLLRHPFLAGAAAVGDDHGAFHALCLQSVEEWRPCDYATPIDAEGRGHQRFSTLQSHLQAYHALRLVAVLQRDGWAALQRAFCDITAALPPSFAPPLLREVFAQAWRYSPTPRRSDTADASASAADDDFYT